MCIFVSSNRLIHHSILLQLAKDDNFIGVRTVVPHVVYMYIHQLQYSCYQASGVDISVSPCVQSWPKMTISYGSYEWYQEDMVPVTEAPPPWPGVITTVAIGHGAAPVPLTSDSPVPGIMTNCSLHQPRHCIHDMTIFTTPILPRR